MIWFVGDIDNFDEKSLIHVKKFNNEDPIASIFSPSSLEMYGFSPSYQILLSLFDILNAFYDNI